MGARLEIRTFRQLLEQRQFLFAELARHVDLYDCKQIANAAVRFGKAAMRKPEFLPSTCAGRYL